MLSTLNIPGIEIIGKLDKEAHLTFKLSKHFVTGFNATENFVCFFLSMDT